MQLIVGQQFDTPLEILGECLYGEIGARPLPRAYRIQRLFEGDAVELFTPVRKQLAQYLADSLAAGRFFRLRSIADMSVHADGVTDILSLDYQCQAVGKHTHDRVKCGGWHGYTTQRPFRPFRQLRRLRFTERNRL